MFQGEHDAAPGMSVAIRGQKNRNQRGARQGVPRGRGNPKVGFPRERKAVLAGAGWHRGCQEAVAKESPPGEMPRFRTNKNVRRARNCRACHAFGFQRLTTPLVLAAMTPTAYPV